MSAFSAATVKAIVSEVIREVSCVSDERSVKTNSIAYVVDISGSTGSEFTRGVSILDKEKTILSNEILGNKMGQNYVLSFSNSYTRSRNYYGEIIVDPDIDFVMLPDGLISGGLTYTAEPLQDIVKLVREGIIKVDYVKIITDGETSSDKTTLVRTVKDLKDLGIKVIVIAVSLNNKDLTKIAVAEGNTLVGMDLLDYLANDLHTYVVYNKFHLDEPYTNAINSDTDKRQIAFFDVPLPKGISMHMLIWSIIDRLHPGINWGMNDFTRMCAEIGKLVAIFNITISSINDFLDNISSEIKKNTMHSMDVLKIRNIIVYGFNCTRNKKPIILSSAEERIAAVEKLNQFENAVDDLKFKGTTLDCNTRISFSMIGIFIDNKTILLPRSLGPYPNSMTEDGTLVFYGLGDSPELEQASRIGIREYCGKLGYPKATISPSVIFHVLNLMSLMFLHGVPFNTYMETLQKFGVIQTKMNRMIAQKTYGESFYASWKKGDLPSMHFSKRESHSSLFADKMINPLGLDEPVWWGLMMAMLGLFDEQLHVYRDALGMMDIEPTKPAFLDYMKRTYSSRVTGNPVFETFEGEQESSITLEPFPRDIEVVCVKDHPSPAGQTCSAKLWFTRDELGQIGGKCVYCRSYLSEADYCTVLRPDNREKLQRVLATAKPLMVTR